jgi:hypothetical protein
VAQAPQGRADRRLAEPDALAGARRVELDGHRVEDAQQIEVQGGEIHGANNLHMIIQFHVADDRTYVDPRRGQQVRRRLKQSAGLVRPEPRSRCRACA